MNPDETRTVDFESKIFPRRNPNSLRIRNPKKTGTQKEKKLTKFFYKSKQKSSYFLETFVYKFF